MASWAKRVRKVRTICSQQKPSRHRHHRPTQNSHTPTEPCFTYQTYVPTDPAFRVAVNTFPSLRTSNFCSESLTFATISTLFPSGVLKATFGSGSRLFESIRIDPGRTNFDA